jgi:uncharacterized protein YydD (DUF2326 family)
MKLSKIYSNNDNIFPPINFRDGLNVVFALVKDPIQLNRDSHNLGKTFLANLIDYCLFGDLETDHPFKQRLEIFGNFVFFLEIVLSDNKFITIRRKVSGRKNICIQTSDFSQDYSSLLETEWEFSALGVGDAINVLNNKLAFDIIKPFDYRKGITYFLRRQADYNDVFQISKFSVGKHKDWKPYMAQILGLNRELVQEKYELDEEIDERVKDKEKLAKKAGTKNQKFDEIKGLIGIKTASVIKLQKQLDNFSFYEMEAEISEDIVKRIESLISEYNQERYMIDYELQEIENSLKTDFIIDATKMFKVFEEVNLIMPESLTKQYDDLVDFNKRISTDRIKRLEELKIKLSNRKTELESALRELNNERQRALDIIKQKETFQKYKSLQKELLNIEEDILYLQQQLKQLDDISLIEHQIESLRVKRIQIIHNLDESLKIDNSTYSKIRQVFAQYVEEILSVPASIYTDINSNGNLEFHDRIIDRAIGQETYQGKGTSYKKVLCACFDLAILSVYNNVRFFHFVYHDGVFEGLDNRRKVKLLNLIRSICQENGIQYILTVIDSDLPRDGADNKLLFREGEIVRQLNDNGDEGRLFRIPIF